MSGYRALSPTRLPPKQADGDARLDTGVGTLSDDVTARLAQAVAGRGADAGSTPKVLVTPDGFGI